MNERGHPYKYLWVEESDGETQLIEIIDSVEAQAFLFIISGIYSLQVIKVIKSLKN